MPNSTAVSAPLESSEELLLLNFFHEIPNRGAAIACACLYAIITVVVAAITIRTRAWFMMTVAVTGALETAGFAFRAAAIAQPTLMRLVLMQCLLIISPVLLAIVEYICVGKLLQMSEAGRGSRFATWVARLFTASDVFCLLLQVAGGGLVSSTDPAMQTKGQNLLLAGLFLQLLFFSTFVAVVLHVQLAPKFGYRANPAMRPLFCAMHITIALMWVRNTFRVVEFLQGWDGYLASHEAYFYALDFVPLYLCFVCFCALHYGFYLPPYGPAAAAMTNGKGASRCQQCPGAALAPLTQCVVLGTAGIGTPGEGDAQLLLLPKGTLSSATTTAAATASATTSLPYGLVPGIYYPGPASTQQGHATAAAAHVHADAAA